MIKPPPQIKDQDLPTFGPADEALLSLQNKRVDIQQEVRVRVDGALVRTSPGRVMFTQVLPLGKQPMEGQGEPMRFQNRVFAKTTLRPTLPDPFRLYPNHETTPPPHKL